MNYFGLRLRLLLKDRTASICCILSAAVIVAVLFGLNIHSAERSSIPVGVINNDSGEEAASLLESLKTNEALYVYEGSFDELWNLMLDGYVNSIYVIEDGYSSAVRAGRTRELVTIHSPGDDKISAVIGDIVAGCMLYDICINKSYLRYDSLDKERLRSEFSGSYDKLSREEYFNYIDSMRDSEDYAFSFDVKYIDSGSGHVEESEITNALLYRQMIAGMLAMLILLVVFCSFNVLVSEYENGVSLRRAVLPYSKFLSVVYELTASVVYSSPIMLLAAFVFAGEGGYKVFARVFCVNLLFSCFCVIIFRVLAGLAGQISTYQLTGALIIIALSVMGFVSVFAGVLGRNKLIYTPVALYIRQLISFGGI